MIANKTVTERMLTTALFELQLVAAKFELSDVENEKERLEDLVVESESYAKLVKRFHKQEYVNFIAK